MAARSGFANKRDTPDLITAKLAALHYYQLSIPPPGPPEKSYDKKAAARGRSSSKAKPGVPRAAALHGARLADAHRRRDRHRRLSSEPRAR